MSGSSGGPGSVDGSVHTFQCSNPGCVSWVGVWLPKNAPKDRLSRDLTCGFCAAPRQECKSYELSTKLDALVATVVDLKTKLEAEERAKERITEVLEELKEKLNIAENLILEESEKSKQLAKEVTALTTTMEGLRSEFDLVEQLKDAVQSQGEKSLEINVDHSNATQMWCIPTPSEIAVRNGPQGERYDGASSMDPEGVIDSNWNEVVDNFDAMELKEELLRGIYAYSFEKPSAIQQRAIIPCVKGHDVIAQAQSGTGKTATFSIAILQKIDTSLAKCQALILAPTRVLAQHIQKMVITLGDYMNAQCHASIGGTNVRDDARKLESGVHVVVGTPGRVTDMINRRALKTANIKIFVLDEADEMLSRGFKDQICDVFRTLNKNTQVILMSAKMPADVLEVTKNFMRDPIQILVKQEELTLEGGGLLQHAKESGLADGEDARKGLYGVLH
ncbi:unnamed protein product, partial [Cyprideis torosa]